MMSRLKILLFGTFQVLLDDQPITGFRSDKARALLIYLAVEAGRQHAPRSLAALLWPDASDAAALTYLRGALANLRQLLGDDQAQTQKPSFLQSTRDTIQLAMAAGVWLDTAAFAAACAGNPKP